MDLTPRCLGREPELATLAKALDALGGAGMQVVVISGEAGIGKTRLLDEVGRMAEVRGVPTVRGAWLETKGAPPFWAWQQVLEPLDALCSGGSALTEAERGLVARTMPDVHWLQAGARHHRVNADSSQERFAAFNAVARLISAAAKERGLVVLLDDLQWADEASLRLLEYVARQPEGAHVLTVMTHRDVGLHEALRQSLGEVTRATAPTRLQLRGLNAVAVGEQLVATSGRTPAPEVVMRIKERTGGNPLFVREYGLLLAVQAAEADAAVDAGIVPDGVRDLVAQRLGPLEPQSLRVLEVASLIGDSVRASLVATVLEDDAASILGHLEQATAHGLLLRDPQDPFAFRFTHDLIRASVAAEVPVARRVGWHQRIAECLEQSLGIDQDVHVSEVAHHWLQAAAGGKDAHTARMAERAADVAMDQLAFEDAARLYLAAAETAASAGEARDVPARLLVASARALFVSGDLANAAATCSRAVMLAGAVHADEIVAAAALVLQGVGDASVSRLIAQWCDDALARIGDRDPGLTSRLQAQRASAAYYMGEYDRVDSLSFAALQAAESAVDVEAMAAALHARQLACSGPERLPERIEIAQRMVVFGQHEARAVDELWGRLWRFDNLVQQGRIADARREAHDLAELVDRVDQPLARWHLERCRFVVAHALGEFDAARQAIADGRSVAAAAGGLARGRHHLQRALLAWLTGEECEEAISALERIAASGGQGAAFTWSVTSQMMLGDVALALGRRQDAARHLDQLPSVDAKGLMPAVATVALAYRAALAAELGRARECGDIFTSLQLFADQFSSGGAGTAGCHGSIHGHLGMCALTAGRVDAAVSHLEQAVARNDEAGMRPWAAISRYWLASALHRRARSSDPARAIVLAAEADETAVELGMKPLQRQVAALTAALRSGTYRGQTMTKREQQIATYVAQGLTNREIAEALHISARTADNHVQHILAKLELRSRAQVGAWLARHTN